MENIIDFLQQTWYDNALWKLFLFCILILLGIIFNKLLAKLLSRILYRFIRKSSHGVGLKTLFELIRKPLRLFFMMIFIYIAFSMLHFPEEWQMASAEEFGIRMIMIKSYQIFLIYDIFWLMIRVIAFFKIVFISKLPEEQRETNSQLVGLGADIVKITVGIFGFMVMLGSVFEVNIGSLIAGLGIGGLAVALAAKETLENLFGSFAIFLDKPFVVGDLVQIDEVTGNVEKIGFRSTRIRTVDKNFATIPNKTVIDAKLINITQRNGQRANYFLYLSQSTPIEKVKELMTTLKASIDGHPKTDENASVRFSEIEKNAFKINVLYFVLCTDWNEYMGIREEINFTMFDIVKELNIEIDYPQISLMAKQ